MLRLIAIGLLPLIAGCGQAAANSIPPQPQEVAPAQAPEDIEPLFQASGPRWFRLNGHLFQASLVNADEKHVTLRLPNGMIIRPRVEHMGLYPHGRNNPWENQ